MLSEEENDRLSRVGPGTPCGELMRRYWIPVAPYAQLLEDPVRKVRILGEDLVLYRDRSATLGLIGDRCLHRAVDLRWGIPDECGLRCPYHGWLYDETGQCIDTPLEAPDSTFKTRLKLTGYPVRELGGLVFAYMGPEPAPALPRWDVLVWPNAVRQIGVTLLNANWLQCQENTGDPLHNVWLHGRFFEYQLEKLGELKERATDQQGHTIHARLKMGLGIKDLYARATQYGMEKGVVYSKELGSEADRVTRHSTVIFPFYTQTGMAGAPRSELQIRVPMDDTHTYHICYQCYSAPPGVEAPGQDGVPWYEIPTEDEDGKPILDYILSHDMIAWTAQGERTDRSAEHLGRSDIPVIFLRKQLEEQIKLVEDGGKPMNVFSEDEAGDVLFGSGSPPEDHVSTDWLRSHISYRAAYHRGFAIDDADRYGPAISLVQELHRRIEAAYERAQAESAEPLPTTGSG